MEGRKRQRAGFYSERRGRRAGVRSTYRGGAFAPRRTHCNGSDHLSVGPDLIPCVRFTTYNKTGEPTLIWNASFLRGKEEFVHVYAVIVASPASLFLAIKYIYLYIYKDFFFLKNYIGCPNPVKCRKASKLVHWTVDLYEPNRFMFSKLDL